MNALLEAWTALIGSEGGRAAGADLLARYAEPHRRYHDVRHLEDVLAIVDELAGEAADPDAVRLAAWFHDAVYAVGHDAAASDAEVSDAAASDAGISNEEASARLAERVLGALGVAEARIRETARLVRLTQTHDPDPADRNAAVLCDADLAILGAAPERYREYAQAVRAEYAAVPDDAFRRGRAEILRSLLAARTLFHTAAARTRYEARARANLAAEIAALTA
ncbi:metal-dependent phosphohydrolase [Actinospica durhamensis]|uniref:Metal-dependent phosphohydrolase n=2 Tax=Actinospica durhamensis TaxID=1508375 RepID=A0A941ISP9_9ACTN|nr:metal-dependent phosphohydrolase [Actinospica durhamensis]